MSSNPNKTFSAFSLAAKKGKAKRKKKNKNKKPPQLRANLSTNKDLPSSSQEVKETTPKNSTATNSESKIAKESIAGGFLAAFAIIIAMLLGRGEKNTVQETKSDPGTKNKVSLNKDSKPLSIAELEKKLDAANAHKKTEPQINSLKEGGPQKLIAAVKKLISDNQKIPRKFYSDATGAFAAKPIPNFTDHGVYVSKDMEKYKKFVVLFPDWHKSTRGNSPAEIQRYIEYQASVKESNAKLVDSLYSTLATDAIFPIEGSGDLDLSTDLVTDPAKTTIFTKVLKGINPNLDFVPTEKASTLLKYMTYALIIEKIQGKPQKQIDYLLNQLASTLYNIYGEKEAHAEDLYKAYLKKFATESGFAYLDKGFRFIVPIKSRSSNDYQEKILDIPFLDLDLRNLDANGQKALVAAFNELIALGKQREKEIAQRLATLIADQGYLAYGIGANHIQDHLIQKLHERGIGVVLVRSSDIGMQRGIPSALRKAA